MKELDALALELSGTTLIEASAGTGKTYTLTTLYLRLLVEKDLLPSQILVVTYTQAATAELRERVRERIREAIAAGDASDEEAEAAGYSPEARRLGRMARASSEMSDPSGAPTSVDPLRRALREFDEAAIFTIHGFCQRALAQNAFESGVAFDNELVEAPDSLEQTLARDLFARAITGEDADFVEWLFRGEGKRWGFKPESLRQDLLGVLGADETMPVLPEARQEAAPDSRGASQDASLEESWVAWATAWPAARERVERWLLEAKDLNRNKYQAATIASTWLPELDALSESDHTDRVSRVPTDLPGWWEKLTTTGLQAGVKKGGVPLVDPIFDAFEAVWVAHAQRIQAFGRRALALRRQVVDWAREEARLRREERHLLVFDDLLSELRAALRPPEGDRLVGQLRDQYRFALIDEFQDTDPVQYEIFRRVWHRDEARNDSGLILIGDPKQAIYSFRGADLFTYLGAGRDAGDAVYGLGINRRSDTWIIAAINRLFDRPEHAFGFEAIAFHPVEARPDAPKGLETKERSAAGLRILFAGYARYATESGIVDEEPDPKDKKSKKKPRELPLRFGRAELMQAMAKDVADLLDSDAQIDGRPIRPSDIAVLGRRKVELERAKRALETLGIPCVDRGDADVFESREAWELVCVLRAMLRSGDEGTLRAALATGAMGWDAGDLVRLDDAPAEVAEISERFAEYGRIWRQSGFMRAFESWRRHEGVTKMLLGFVDGERRLTNWLHLADLLQRVANQRQPSPSGLANWLERAIGDSDLRSGLGSEASLLRLESDEEAVSLITLHRSKGLEYEIVYLPCLWEGISSRLPNAADALKNRGRKPPVRCHDPELDQRILDLGGPAYAENLERHKEESRSEAMRLLYVGLTRAKHQCVVPWGAIGKGAYATTPMAWLLAAPFFESEGKDRAGSEKAIRSWRDADWERAFASLASATGDGAVVVEPADWSSRPRWRSRREALPSLNFDPRSRVVPRARVTTSFSGLTRGAIRPVAQAMGPELVGRDIDAATQRPVISDSAAVADLAADMDSFPRGADAGTLLHEVLERVDFSAWEESAVRSRGSQELERHGLAPSHVDQIVHVVRSVATVPLRTEPTVLRLRDVARNALRAEMEFTLAAPGSAQGSGLTPAALATALREAGPDSPLGCYAERVSRLSWRELQGYLRGFIDAVFCDGERYYLIDYKSNHLGPRQSDYAPPNLLAPMIDHDYVLQYLIYTIALDRHLMQTLTDYRYETHFGGAYYLFLRGMAETHPQGTGIFFDRPDESVVRRVSDLLGGSEISAAAEA